MSVQKPKSERNRPLSLDDAACDALTALLAARDGLATEAQIEKAFAEKRKAPPGEAPRLAKIFVAQGILDEKQARELEKRLDPEVLPGYRILAEVGRGGMGTVFKARQLSMDRVVALKILAKRLSSDARYVEKFLYEARAAGKLNHENIVSAIDCGAASGLHYFVMEFVDGKTVLATLTASGKLPWEKAFEYAEQVARALDHAHANGLVHRDVKPENLIVTETPQGTRVKLCDLGLAKEAVEAGTGEKSKMTEGTPAYASPEQALGRTDIDARSDVYSLGATLYHMLAGEPPFDGESAKQILWKQVHKPFPDLARALPEVPPAFRDVLARMVEKDREKRLPSARAFLEEVAKARAPRAPEPAAPAKGPGKALAAVGLVAVLLAVGLVGSLASGKTPPAPPPPTPPPVLDVPPPPKSTPSLVRVDDPPPPPPGAPPVVARPTPDEPSPGGDDGEGNRAAQLLLERAMQFRDTAPDDTAGFTKKLEDVVSRHPGTAAAIVAGKELQVLRSAGLAAFEQDLETARKDAATLAAAGKWKEGANLLDGLSEKYDARLVAPHKKSLEDLRQKIVDAARARLQVLGAEADAHLAKGEPVDPTLESLAALEKAVPDAVAKEVRARIDDVRSKQATAAADARVRDALAARDEAFGQGNLEAALKAIADLAKDPKAAPRKARVDEVVAECEQIATVWRDFDSRVKAFETDVKRSFKKQEGPPVEGQLRDYDGAAWTAKLKPYGRKDLVALDLRDLAAADLVDLAVPKDKAGSGSDLRAATLYFVARRETEAAYLALDRMVAAGLPDDPALRARIAGLRSLDRESKAQALVGRALAPGAVNKDPEEVAGLIRQVVDRYPDTNAYLDRLDDVKKVYLAARSTFLAGNGIAQLFSAHVTRTKESFKLEYDFSKDQGGGAREWIPDTNVSKDSAVRWAKNKLYVKGKVRNIAVWEGGAISVDARVNTPSAARPNVNLIISDKGGWQGVLVGFGFIYGSLNGIKLHGTALKKPGWREPLPANVIYDLEGKEPEFAGKCLAAEADPSCGIGRALHYIAKRDAKGVLRGQLGTQVPCAVPNSPRADEAGAVSIAGFETELAVEHVEIIGRIDLAWLADRARTIADAEVKAFPGRKP